MFAKIIERFSSATKKSGFDKFIWRLYGHSSILLKHQKAVSQSINSHQGVYSTLKKASEEMLSLAKQHNRFSYWLLGFDKIIGQYRTLTLEAKTLRDGLFQKQNIAPKLNPLKLTDQTKQDSTNLLTSHFKQKIQFMKQITQPKFSTMPYVVDRFGRHNQILAFSKNPGLVMNYRNLKKEIDQNKESLRELKMNQPRNYDVNHLDRNRSFQNWSDEYDAISAVIYSAEDKLDKIKKEAPEVKIDKLGSPFVALR